MSINRIIAYLGFAIAAVSMAGVVLADGNSACQAVRTPGNPGPPPATGLPDLR